MIKRINKIKNLGVFSNYTRNSELKDFDEKNRIKVQQFLSSLILGREFPSAFALDLGVLSTGEVALIEMNDAFSIGKYNGIDDKTYAEFVITRWEDLKNGRN